MSPGALVEASDLGWSFGSREIVGGLDLAVTEGESVAVVGPNGAGKTTLLRLLAGLLTPTHGKIMWRGRDLRTLGRRQLARQISYVPQVRPADVPLRVKQLVTLGRHPHFGRFQMTLTEDDHRAVRSALDLAGLSRLADRSLNRLSGGERQSVYIAAALAQEAELLVLDEPTTHLDPAHRRQVAALVNRLRRAAEEEKADGGHTLIVATHDLHLAVNVADRIVALKGGRLIAAGPPREMMSPELLQEIFDAPFETVRGGFEPRVLLDYESSTGAS